MEQKPHLYFKRPSFQRNVDTSYRNTIFSSEEEGKLSFPKLYRKLGPISENTLNTVVIGLLFVPKTFSSLGILPIVIILSILFLLSSFISYLSISIGSKYYSITSEELFDPKCFYNPSNKSELHIFRYIMDNFDHKAPKIIFCLFYQSSISILIYGYFSSFKFYLNYFIHRSIGDSEFSNSYLHEYFLLIIPCYVFILLVKFFKRRYISSEKEKHPYIVRLIINSYYILIVLFMLIISILLLSDNSICLYTLSAPETNTIRDLSSFSSLFSNNIMLLMTFLYQNLKFIFHKSTSSYEGIELLTIEEGNQNTDYSINHLLTIVAPSQILVSFFYFVFYRLDLWDTNSNFSKLNNLLHYYPYYHYIILTLTLCFMILSLVIASDLVTSLLNPILYSINRAILGYKVSVHHNTKKRELKRNVYIILLKTILFSLFSLLVHYVNLSSFTLFLICGSGVISIVLILQGLRIRTLKKGNFKETDSEDEESFSESIDHIPWRHRLLYYAPIFLAGIIIIMTVISAILFVMNTWS
jgi:hypothetical protein